MRFVKPGSSRRPASARGYAERTPDGLAIVDLASARSDEVIGGKADGLRRAARLGLPIPPTLVIPAGVHQVHQDRGGPLPLQWRARLTAAARTLGTRIAVRSSAPEEDGARSYAGIHTTVLNVAPEDVPDAVLRVWASVHGEAAEAYGQASGMAVVLQRQLQPEAAGVLFTVNPHNGSWRELVLEGVRGQGEALVSGRQAPQWAVFRRPRDLPRFRRPNVRLVSEGLTPQPQRWKLDDHGQLVAEPIPVEIQEHPVLPPATRRRLCQLGLKVERAFGEPVDVEWAWADEQLVLLQARPITGTGSPRVRDVLWTRRFLGERFPLPPTPLTWSLLEPLFDHFIAYPDMQERYLGGGAATRIFGGYPYLNVTVFRHLLFKWPGAPAPEFMLELIPPDEADAWRRRFAVRADWSVYRAIFETTFEERRWERFAWNPFTNHRVWDRFERDFLARIEVLSQPVPPGEALQRVDTIVELIRDYLAIHVCSLLFANLWYQLLDGALAAWMGPGPWMAELAVCPPGNHTLRTNEALWALARQATPDDLERLERAEATGRFAEALEAFLDAFGHRAEASWEVFSPRWRDEPQRLVSLLRSADSEPARGAAEREAAFQRTRNIVLAAVPGWRKRVLDGLIDITRRYLLLRENQRFQFDRLLALLRRTFDALDEERGLGGTVRWHTLDELRTAETVDPEVLREREAAWGRQCDIAPPVFIRGEQPLDEQLTGRRLQGLGISAGRVQGHARVVRTLEQGAALRDGEILVAPAVDPAWTPLLLRAGGVVLELGSMLSHGAVIAREYDVPGVVNLSGATTHLRTGQLLTVDGSRGEVWIEQ